ncbi:MAG: hypothetical protein WKG07_21090 [Hymenobacter sp.]
MLLDISFDPVAGVSIAIVPDEEAVPGTARRAGLGSSTRSMPMASA